MQFPAGLLKHRNCQRFAAATLVAIVLGVWGCQSQKGQRLTVTVENAVPLPSTARLVVTATEKTRTVLAEVATNPSTTWPVVLILDTRSFSGGDTIVEARTYDVAQNLLARGTGSVVLSRSSSISVDLVCQSLSCTASDGGVSDAPTDGASDAAGGESRSKCGNGILDPLETCDTAIPRELPGSCPQDCNDAIACTQDRQIGSACNVVCEHTEVTGTLATDGCCPAGATSATDPDCSLSCGNQTVERGEACDTGIASGPGACPLSAASCDDSDPCTQDGLISAGTCSARCSHVPIVTATAGDRCCPLGADSQSDSDCAAACGNGILEAGELCDPGILGKPMSMGACPTQASCDDGNPCTTDLLNGSGCQADCVHIPITKPAPFDGCCPSPKLGPNVDSDCAAICGNGILETGESCDKGITESLAGRCPETCSTSTVACLVNRLVGTVGDCSASCQMQALTGCSAIPDGCCPTGCGSASDPDCPATCGNGKVDPGETCDAAIANGMGSCPQSCSDGVPCTDDILIDEGSCTARCQFVTTTANRNGDGCCPSGANASLDSDCPSICGNGVVESPWETCDTATTPSSCDTGCPPADSCSRYVMGSDSSCNLACERTTISACQSGDGCCPAGAGCTVKNDTDCGVVCGNGVVDVGEACDKAISAGRAGACDASCGDGDACTIDSIRGRRESCDRVCTHTRISACASGDRCCPSGCTAETDSDCAATCGDGVVQSGETCDPRTSCPASCFDDGDACTSDQLTGSADDCTAACTHVPISRCSGTTRDGCCPTDCTRATDSDC